MNKDLSAIIFYSVTCMIYFSIMFLGISTNMIVVLANDGKMPVRCNVTLNDGLHFCYDKYEDIKLATFSDKFQVKNLVFSLGDILIAIGGIFFIISYYKLWKHARSNNKNK